jgi:hypothetical protein
VRDTLLRRPTNPSPSALMSESSCPRISRPSLPVSDGVSSSFSPLGEGVARFTSPAARRRQDPPPSPQPPRPVPSAAVHPVRRTPSPPAPLPPPRSRVAGLNRGWRRRRPGGGGRAEHGRPPASVEERDGGGGGGTPGSGGVLRPWRGGVSGGGRVDPRVAGVARDGARGGRSRPCGRSLSGRDDAGARGGKELRHCV